MSDSGAAPRAAVAVSNARAAASRINGAKSRGPNTSEGKARSAQNALKHGMRSLRYVVLSQEDAAEFAQFQAALLEELAPVGVLQTVLARRIVIAAWRLARADRMEAELLEFRSYEGASPGLALIRDGNGTKSIETLVRYRNSASAEFTRAVRTLQMLQAGKDERNARPAILPAPRNPRRRAIPVAWSRPRLLWRPCRRRARRPLTPLPARSRRSPR
jgi:hypothetical protein